MTYLTKELRSNWRRRKLAAKKAKIPHDAGAGLIAKPPPKTMGVGMVLGVPKAPPT